MKVNLLSILNKKVETIILVVISKLEKSPLETQNLMLFHSQNAQFMMRDKLPF